MDVSIQRITERNEYMDCMEPLLTYTDEIWKLAFARCGNTADADDLTQDTYLAALSAIRQGKEIRFPKTWLAHTMMHLWNSRLREKYRIQWLGRMLAYYETAVYGILYDKGIHLTGVDFCCPPAVLVIE